MTNELAWYAYPALLLAGVLAGIINTLAGNGSLVTLTIMMLMGLPANIANGTNRLGVFPQTLVGVLAFRESGRVKHLIKDSLWFSLPTVIGAVLGAMAAVRISKDALETVIGVLMVVMMAVIVAKPSRWLRPTDQSQNTKTLANLLIFFGIGLYAGFIQMGMGLMFLAALVLGARYSLLEANIIKLIIVFAFSLPVILVFAGSQQIDWIYAVLLSVGQSVGAWFSAKFALRNDRAAVWVHRLLVVMVLVAVIKTLKLYEWFW